MDEFYLKGVEGYRLKPTKPHQFLHIDENQYNLLESKNLISYINIWKVDNDLNSWVFINDPSLKSPNKLYNWTTENNLNEGYIVLIHNKVGRYLNRKYQVRVQPITIENGDDKFVKLQATSTMELN